MLIGLLPESIEVTTKINVGGWVIWVAELVCNILKPNNYSVLSQWKHYESDCVLDSVNFCFILFRVLHNAAIPVGSQAPPVYHVVPLFHLEAERLLLRHIDELLHHPLQGGPHLFLKYLNVVSRRYTNSFQLLIPLVQGLPNSSAIITHNSSILHQFNIARLES